MVSLHTLISDLLMCILENVRVVSEKEFRKAPSCDSQFLAVSALTSAVI